MAVPFNEPTPAGLPSPEDDKALGDFEDQVVGIAGARAVLAAVITTQGMREFVLYTGEGAWIEQFHLDLKQVLPSHDVQVMAQADPRRQVYETLG
ncbi:DUF695 domain-containing protein [Nonomuraea muscovyensis]|uniref:DUF695 domain-containing protein n=1 Tax=Nonomuraea muscovyensis TaxID=1124761 RepID=UPI0035E44878